MKKTVELEKEDIAHLHDVILEALNRHLTDEEVIDFYNKLPQHLKDEAEHWGLDDSVVRDNIYEWLEEHVNAIWKE